MYRTCNFCDTLQDDRTPGSVTGDEPGMFMCSVCSDRFAEATEEDLDEAVPSPTPGWYFAPPDEGSADIRAFWVSPTGQAWMIDDGFPNDPAMVPCLLPENARCHPAPRVMEEAYGIDRDASEKGLTWDEIDTSTD